MHTPLSELLDLYNPDALLEEAYTLPAAWYRDEQIASLEHERIFSRNWIAVGRVDQVAVPGQFFTINLTGEPLIVVRGADGELRAFYNVCRHHATAVANVPCGIADHLRCPYHGWTYGLDGSLKGAPEFAGVRDFNRAENGLVPIRAATWEQFVFITLNENAPSLEHFLGDLPVRTAPLSLSKIHFFERKTYTLACNWKVYMDNYLDGGYHVPHLHKGLNSVLDYKEYTIENSERYCLQTSPMVATHDNTSIGTTRTGDRAYYYWLYPNFMINVYEGVMDTNLVLPLTADTCLVQFDFFFSDISDNKESYNLESVTVSDRIQDEDVAICESVQRGLHSRAYGAGRLSVRREAGEHLFHRLLANDLRNLHELVQLTKTSNE
ncbi:aromatic ring-hydroxylating dioxygenase subunit alpha [Alloacidobacterium dinghuense]|uniref:Aromatic ring-hydroxylating dioxygenase subunit alpha n=1 Tax=Alloacidobacterium dinghuense TaxID=2763107 RepID=A0A7G8BL02_9BACT|nr:aromatic ring-hydroxylating dioxygenase subunit alpha [Alloacidobacterium dinghuense]QNI33222.1 aromatic ring-hydroxylating dioxygenase subunit alpha [Alloacidobacterium dinghuense]